MYAATRIYAYLFEVRSIQTFLFSTGKLKDVVAGSELLDYLCTEPLQKVLDVCGLAGYDNTNMKRSPRCAGGSFYLLLEDKDKALRFRQMWTALVSQLLPGVEQADALVSAETASAAIQQGLEALRISRNLQAPQFPAASPITERSPRTGNPAVEFQQGESLDEATARKRQFKRPTGSLTLAQRFSNRTDIHWPVNFEQSTAAHTQFPLREGDQVALVHADGNGLGEILRVVNQAASHAHSDEDYVQIYRSFSDGLNSALIEACQRATEQILLPCISNDRVIPARPLVLGGDDLTLLVRADLAIGFAEAFILAFEQTSAEFLERLTQEIKALQLYGHNYALPSKLTACAGIVFMKPNQPFSQCYALAESLCDRAKKASRRTTTTGDSIIPSSLAFHRIKTSLIEDADALFEREMQVSGQGLDLQLGLPAYAIGRSNTSNLACLDDLKTLSQCFTEGKLNDKRLRALATLLHVDPVSARQDYQRWRELAQKNPQQKKALEQFDAGLQALLNSASESLPTDVDEKKTVLSDLLVYLQFGLPITSATQQGGTA
jgi:hypothetical protein